MNESQKEEEEAKAAREAKELKEAANYTLSQARKRYLKKIGGDNSNESTDM